MLYLACFVTVFMLSGPILLGAWESPHVKDVFLSTRLSDSGTVRPWDLLLPTPATAVAGHLLRYHRHAPFQTYTPPPPSPPLRDRAPVGFTASSGSGSSGWPHILLYHKHAPFRTYNNNNHLPSLTQGRVRPQPLAAAAAASGHTFFHITNTLGLTPNPNSVPSLTQGRVRPWNGNGSGWSHILLYLQTRSF